MGTPARTLALANLKSALEGIRVADGYKTTVTTVEPVLRQLDELGAAKLPWIGFGAETERPEYQPFGLMRMTFQVRIWAYVSAASKAALTTALHNLLDDIIAALHADITRGGNAVSTKVLPGIETDEAHPDSTDVQGLIGTIVMPIELSYERTTSST